MWMLKKKMLTSGFCIAEWFHLKRTTGCLRHITISGVIWEILYKQMWWYSSCGN